MDLQALSNLAQIVGVIAVVVGFLFAWEQMRHTREQRQIATAAELIGTVQDSDFTRAMLLILSLPEDCSASELRSHGEEYEAAAMLVAVRFEIIGFYVFRKVMPVDLVEQLCGGVAIKLWQRLRNWAEERRTTTGQATWMEWNQWLAERFIERGRDTALPAWQRYRTPLT